MAQDATEITVAADGNLHIAPYGTALPADTGTRVALNAAFFDVGYTSEDGMTFSAGAEVEDIRVWQKATPARRIVTGRSLAVSGSLAQWNEETFAVAFGGGEWNTTSAGVYRYDPPGDSDAITEYSAVLDWADGDNEYRLVVRRATLADDVETQLVRNGPALLPISLTALTPDDADNAWFVVTNNANFSAS